MSEAIRQFLPDDAEVVPDQYGMYRRLRAMDGKIDGLVKTVGEPGGVDSSKATGVFAYLENHHLRLKKFEKLWERGMGFALGAGPLIIVIWWLAGDRVWKLFHG